MRTFGKKEGFTIIEILVAVTLILIALLPLMYLFLNSQRGIIQSRSYLRAQTLVENRLERWRNTLYDNIVDRVEWTNDNIRFPELGVYPTPYTIITNVTELTRPPQKTVDVRAEWLLEHRTNHLQLRTIISQW
ncbi:TPA: hypothetical protein DCX15_06295 [bacterium]|nr:hypothetical protein [bacterium]